MDEALARVGMEAYRKRQIGELSGGQRKRVFLARALAQEGQVILLDEPFTGVDVTTEEQITQLLRELRDEGKVMLVSTHNLGSVPEFCDRAVLINRRILALGTDGRGVHPGQPADRLWRHAAPLRAQRGATCMTTRTRGRSRSCPTTSGPSSSMAKRTGSRP